MNAKQEVIILGGGVCGLYAALTALRRGAQVTLIEQNAFPGGLAAGYKRGANHFDQGVHMLHAADRGIYQDMAKLMGGERVAVALDARIQWNNRSFRYPLKGLNILAGMNPLQLVRSTLGLILADLENRLKDTQQAATTAEDALIATYGLPLYESFFENFTHRYWNVHPSELSAEFVRRKMPRLNVLDLVKKCLPGFLAPKPKDLVVESALADEELHYSATGSETLPRVMSGEIERLGGVIMFGTEIQKITDDQIHFKDRSLPWRHLVSTIPLPSLVELLEPVPSAVRDAARKLDYKPIVTYGLLVRKQRCLEGLYTYYRNRIFHRVGEPKAAGLKVSPEDHTVLIVEMTCDRNDVKWNDSAEVRQCVIDDLLAEEICGPEDIVEWHHFTNPHGYPIYRVDFDKHLGIVQTWLDTQDRLVSTGRQGAFTFPGMHQAMRMGQVAVDELLT